jgi:hypothetical protein
MLLKGRFIFERIIRTYSYVQLEANRHDRNIVAIFGEMLYLFGKNSIGPSYYLLAGMADKNMPWYKKCQHLGDAKYHQALDILNPKPYRKITQNKINEKAFLTFSKVETARFLGFYHPVNGFDIEGGTLTNLTELSIILSTFQGKNICIKLPEGFGGKDFFAGKVHLKKREGTEIGLQCIGTERIQSMSQVLEVYADIIPKEGLLFEEYIEQCPEYAKFNSTSVNTVRTWVLQTEEGISVIGAYFRIGREGSLTDNGDGGGIMCPVDIESGTLAKGLLTSTPYRDNLTQHCDNHVQLEGTVLSGWQEIINCSCETLRKLPYTRFAGLDVCMTTSGPAIIEVNVQPDKDGAAYAQIPSYLLAQAASELERKLL